MSWVQLTDMVYAKGKKKHTRTHTHTHYIITARGSPQRMHMYICIVMRRYYLTVIDFRSLMSPALMSDQLMHRAKSKRAKIALPSSVGLLLYLFL